VTAKSVPTGADWLHEVKFDGYRVHAHKVGSRVVIYSGNGDDFSERFPSIAQLLREPPAKAAILDGEVVASDADARPNFARLHVRWTRPGAIHLWAFYLLAFNGRDVRLQPLVKRQARLQKAGEAGEALRGALAPPIRAIAVESCRSTLARPGPLVDGIDPNPARSRTALPRRQNL
jgi:bifunctional non-homologous end joining protein LigD